MALTVHTTPGNAALRRGCAIRAALVGALQSKTVSYERANYLAGQVMAEAAVGVDPFTDSTPDHYPQLSDKQRATFQKLLRAMGLDDLNVERVLQQIDTAVGVQRLSEELNRNAASNNALDENTASAGGIGASAGARGGEYFISERVDARLRRLAQGADPGVTGVCGRAEQAAGRAPAPPAPPARRTLDLRLHSGRNVTERAVSLVRSRNPTLDFDSAWVEACDLLRRAREDGTEILG